jgi:hypothetical protein
MKLIDSMAFDAADAFCDCKEGDSCVAGVYMKAYQEGFRKAREMAADLVYNYSLNDPFCVNASNAIDAIGEEEA